MPDDATPVLLGRDAILKADDRPTEDVPCPEWGGVVRIRGLDGRGRDAYETENVTFVRGQQYPNTEDARARLVARCVVDENGDLVFTEADVAALSAKSAVALNRVWERCMALSGLTFEDMEELEGKSPGGTGSGSPSNSPATSGSRRGGRSSPQSTPAT